MEVRGFTEAGMIDATIDGVRVIVPNDMANFHRRMIAEWESAGNVIQPYVPPAPTIDDYKLAIVALLDAKAQERRYDSAVTISSYDGSTNVQWAAEAEAFVAWRDAVWAYAYAELDKVLTGERPQPTIGEFMVELPVMEWPG